MQALNFRYQNAYSEGTTTENDAKYLQLQSTLVIFFLNSSTLICRSTDISKYFRESLGVRDNKSRLYIIKVLNIPLVGMPASFDIPILDNIHQTLCNDTLIKPILGPT